VASEEDPVSPVEDQLRRFNCGRKLKEALASGGDVPLEKFLPKEGKDDDGLSVYRDVCQRSSVDIVTCLTKGVGAQEIGIARLPTYAVLESGMSVSRRKVPGPPGHCVLPELTFHAVRKAEFANSLFWACRAHKRGFAGVFEAGTGATLVAPQERPCDVPP
jgi:hypothetical protein